MFFERPLYGINIDKNKISKNWILWRKSSLNKNISENLASFFSQTTFPMIKSMTNISPLPQNIYRHFFCLFVCFRILFSKLSSLFANFYLKFEAHVYRLEPETCNFIKKETLAQVFSRELCEISKNTFFTEHLRITASIIWD